MENVIGEHTNSLMPCETTFSKYLIDWRVVSYVSKYDVKTNPGENPPRRAQRQSTP